jgi:hypothetical protein
VNLAPALGLVLLLAALPLSACDPLLYARVQANLASPIDSACLRGALEERFGPATMKPAREKPTRIAPASLWLYYGNGSFTATYPDTGAAALMASELVTGGLAAVRPRAKTRAREDSVRQLLEGYVLALRDACGGHVPANAPATSIPR